MNIPEKFAGMRRLSVGIYDDGRGGLHINAEEVCAARGVPCTAENFEAVAAAAARHAAQHEIPIVEVR